MKLFLQVAYFAILTISLLSKVNCRHDRLSNDLNNNEENFENIENNDDNDAIDKDTKGGIQRHFLRPRPTTTPLLLPGVVPPVPPIAAVPPIPSIITRAPHVHLPNIILDILQHHRPILPHPSHPRPLIDLFASAGVSAELASLHLPWSRTAFSQCDKVDPKELTLVLPTATNGLSAPKIYFFQNETSEKVSWKRAEKWCTVHGMNLLTVNDANENKVIVEILEKLLEDHTPGTISDNTIDENPTSFWIGLTNKNQLKINQLARVSTSTFTDWHPTEPNPSLFCAAYNQVTSINNIHMDALACNTKLRYICEVSDECTELYFSKFSSVNDSIGD